MLSNRRTVLIEWGDCDPSGIVFNPRYFAWFDASLHALLAKAGFTLSGLVAEYGIDGIPLVENRAKFHAPSRYGDTVTLETQVTALHRCAFDLQHRLLRGDTLAVEAWETRVWTAFDAEAGRVRARPLPPAVIQALSA